MQVNETVRRIEQLLKHIVDDTCSAIMYEDLQFIDECKDAANEALALIPALIEHVHSPHTSPEHVQKTANIEHDEMVERVAHKVQVAANAMGIKLRTNHGSSEENAWQLAISAISAMPQSKPASSATAQEVFELKWGEFLPPDKHPATKIIANHFWNAACAWKQAEIAEAIQTMKKRVL